MTDELNRASAEPEATNSGETVPALLSENNPIGADVEENTVWDDMPGKVTVVLPPDWLKPMDEDEEDGVESVRRIPKVKRRRGRPPSARNVRQGLNRLDFKKGLHMDRTRRTKSVRSLMEMTRHSSPKSGTATPIPEPTRKPEVLPRTIQSIIHGSTSTPQRPRITPCSPAESLSNTPHAEFNSPPRLTRVSPLNMDTSGTRNFVHSPSVKVGNVSQQIISSSSEPGKGSTELPLRLWLYPSLEPISPTKTQDGLILDQTLSSPGFPETTLNGTMALKERHPVLSKCVNCGCPFSAQKPGDTLCFRCRPKPEKQHSPPNIVFRKVGQDQWEVGKTKHPRKQILKPRPKYKNVVNKDFAPDGDEDEDDWAQKKRNRRMCRQCDACLLENDCGKCDFCMDKPKFGGSNKKRQKCRLRQCKFQSKLHARSRSRKLNQSLPQRRNMKSKIKRRGRPGKKRRFRSKPWEEDDDDDDDDEEMSDKEDDEDVKPYKMNGSRARGRRKWNYSFKEEDDDMFVEAVIEDDEPSNIEEDPDILGNERSVVESNVMYSNTSGLGAQGLYYNMSGMPVASQMLGSVPLSNNNPAPLGEVIGSLPMGDDVTQNGFLQIEMVRVGSPPSHFTEEQHLSEHQQEATPVITQIFSLAGAESDCDRDQGLMELFTLLGQTVLPPHWVCVMAKGPVLQLLQCSKLSTMADTIVQIEKGFFYQVSVQNQPLLLMHAVYSRHPTCLETVDEVVALLLDLEGLGVCQGYQSLDMGSPWEPRMCVRAALCDLLISKDEEHCVKCTQPVEG
ncbi:methyl-CpG-binding domain protein 1a isoform X3 [Pseudorasbora parva]|uniref:methyl-CpG-binding domain protein 1a isoform X3 n=1 Tax=Pseudorasbora parva TaxID=51549 RepID=UPI00351F2AC3